MITPVIGVTEPITDILARAVAGEGLTRTEAYELIAVDESDLSAVMRAAAQVRDRFKGRTITYSRKVFAPLTNLCRDTCGYCTFVKQPDNPDAATMTLDQVRAVARVGARTGCKEVLFSLGDKPELKYSAYRDWLASRGYRTTLAYLHDACAVVLRETGLLPHVNPGVMRSTDIASLRTVSASMGIMLESISDRLLRPGGPHYRCPDKAPRVRLAMLEAAGRQKVAFTTGILIGIGETPEERVDALFAIKALHARYGHIQEVIIQNFRAKADIAMRAHPDATVTDMACTIAVARLILGDMNIQAPPNLTPDAYQFYLLAGINDWGGISPVTLDFINPERPWPQIDELRRVTAEAGFELRERLSIYPEYITRRRDFIPDALLERVTDLADEHGFVKREAEAW